MSETSLKAGTRVVAVRGRRRLAGVLLPAAARGGLRVHTDDDKVVDITKGPGTWTLAAEQGLAERRADKRRTECPDGRPLYRHGDLPAEQLATLTMLKRRRRRLAEEQEPIASYLMMRGYAPLYAVADTIALPVLSETRQARRDAVRTCARCRGRRGDADQPFPKWHHDGRRYCDPCQEPAAEARWHAQRAIGRQAAAEWAAGVLADPTAVLIRSRGAEGNVHLRAETLDGEIIVNAQLYRGKSPSWWPPEDRVRCVPPADVVDQFRALQGRRLIIWRDHWTDLGQLNQTMAPEVFPDVVALSAAHTDELGPYWDQWIGERSPGMRSFYQNQRLHHQPQPEVDDWRDLPAALLAHMRQALTAMASPDEADEEPACRVCGCTENAACPGGCHWVPDPTMTGELCSRCVGTAVPDPT